MFAHIGWGEALFLKDIFPEAKLLLYCEFFYRARGADTGFDPEFPPSSASFARLRVMNAPLLMALEAADLGVAPTHWQRRQFSPGYKDRIAVIHDGVDTDRVLPGEQPEEELITYVARNLEPYRGFHVFMRAIPEIQRRRPKARIVIVGGDEVSYSPRLPPGETYRERLLRELEGKIDLSRVHFAGTIAYRDYLDLLRRSAVHVYLTYPFVLSWSLLEAMACGCLVVGSRTPPVQEVIARRRRTACSPISSPPRSSRHASTRPWRGSASSDPCARRRGARCSSATISSGCACPAQLRLVERLLERERADAGAAADVEHLAGDESRVAVGEEHHRARDVVGLA